MSQFIDLVKSKISEHTLISKRNMIINEVEFPKIEELKTKFVSFT